MAQLKPVWPYRLVTAEPSIKSQILEKNKMGVRGKVKNYYLNE